MFIALMMLIASSREERHMNAHVSLLWSLRNLDDRVL
jgi:hypothetical protein